MKYDKTKYFQVIDDGKLTTSELLKKCKEKFKTFSFWNDSKLDEFPPPKEPTTRYFKRNVEADENLKDMSANDLKEKGILGITIRERIILELNYFNETGGHLDTINWTLCSDSHDGDVTDANWDDGIFEVGWCGSDNRRSCLRAREAIIFPDKLDTLHYDKLDDGVKCEHNFRYSHQEFQTSPVNDVVVCAKCGLVKRYQRYSGKYL